MPRTNLLILIVALVLVGSCSSGDPQKNNAVATAPKPVATPAKNFTSADVAKLKWIEGAWRGMDGDKPFFERYKIDGDAMIVETLKEDGSLDGDPERFELKNGEFGMGAGDNRSAASEISETHVQFVPVVPGGKNRNSFRFEKQSDGTWIALLEWPANGDKPAGRKLYRMEHWQPPAK